MMMLVIIMITYMMMMLVIKMVIYMMIILVMTMMMFTVETVGGRERSRGFCGSLSFLHQLGELWGKMIIMMTLIMRMVMILRARMMTRMAMKMVFVAFELGFDFRGVKRNKAAQKFRITLTLQMPAHTDDAS